MSHGPLFCGIVWVGHQGEVLEPEEHKRALEFYSAIQDCAVASVSRKHLGKSDSPTGTGRTQPLLLGSGPSSLWTPQRAQHAFQGGREADGLDERPQGSNPAMGLMGYKKKTSNPACPP